MAAMTDTEIILADLQHHDSQSSWDWTADLRFAEALGFKEEAALLRDIQAPAFWPTAMVGHRKFIKRPITDRRLRTLRRLVGQGLVEAYWVGTGEGGVADFGVRRVRVYRLKED